MTLTIVGVLFGALLAYPFLLAVMGTNIVELVMYLYTIYPLSYFYAFLLTFFVAFLINVVFVIRTKKIKMVESLKSVE
jgi:ABC-type antimicrobial peptide transport system permease subunit